MTPGAGHTPGPWTALHEIAFLTVRDARGRKITEAATRDPNTNQYGAEDDANARLIAAAPDLLAACEALVDAEDERSACDSPEAAADVYRKIEAARAAIAKARGTT